MHRGVHAGLPACPAAESAGKDPRPEEKRPCAKKMYFMHMRIFLLALPVSVRLCLMMVRSTGACVDTDADAGADAIWA